MARIETDRDDLFEELRSCRLRVEWHLGGDEPPVVAGIRARGGTSIYFGGDPVFHFDAEGRLRRAFIDGAIFRTQGTTLARLLRDRTPTETLLRRTDLTGDECAALLDSMRLRLERFLAAERQGDAAVTRSSGGDPREVIEALAAVIATPRLAPAIPTKRD